MSSSCSKKIMCWCHLLRIDDDNILRIKIPIVMHGSKRAMLLQLLWLPIGLGHLTSFLSLFIYHAGV